MAIDRKGVEILIAEDSATQAERLAYLLEEKGFRVRVATNGRDAIEQARLRMPTLVITDVLMPEMNGFELCRGIKSDPVLREIPVMLVTTLSDPHDVIRALESGADLFVRKPYEDRYLLSRIDYVLMNLELRQHRKVQIGMEITLGGERHFIRGGVSSGSSTTFSTSRRSSPERWSCTRGRIRWPTSWTPRAACSWEPPRPVRSRSAANSIRISRRPTMSTPSGFARC